MELSDETAKNSPITSNVVTGFASDIKITFKNKTIIAPIHKPTAGNESKAVIEQKPQVAIKPATTQASSNIIKIPFSQKKTNTKEQKQNEKKEQLKMNFFPVHAPVNERGIGYQGPLPAGIPRSFLVNPPNTSPRGVEAPPVRKTPPSSQGYARVEKRPDPVKQSNVEHLEVPDWIRTIVPVEDESDSAVACNNMPAYYASVHSASVQASQINDFDLESDGDVSTSGKRMNKFDIAGPLMPPVKIQKMTINLLRNQNQDENEREEKEQIDAHLAVIKRPEVQTSKDEVVLKCIRLWPWREEIPLRRIVNCNEKGSISSEFERLLDENEKLNIFVQVCVSKVPKDMTKAEVLDILLDRVRDKFFVPIFIELTKGYLKFMVSGHRGALLALYKSGLKLRYESHVMPIDLAVASIKSIEMNFVTRVLKKKLLDAFDGERKLDLRAFLLKPDIIHFIYFPLKRIANQMQLRQLDVIEWNYIVELDLSDNKLKSIAGFELASRAIRLRRLNLSNNLIPKVSALLSCRGMALKSLILEGNPLCNDYYTDPLQYLKAVRLIFTQLEELDGVEIVQPGELPPPVRNFCPVTAMQIVEKYLETFFPLLEASEDERYSLMNMYDEDCILTMTHNFKYSGRYQYLCQLLAKCRAPEHNNYYAVKGAAAVIQLVSRWPTLVHDPSTFVVDVLHHSDEATIIKVSGAVKITAESLAVDEQLLSFTRTVVLSTEDGLEYKICNEMIYWDKPSKELEIKAFAMTLNKLMVLNTKFDRTPDDGVKEKLVAILSATTSQNVEESIRLLEKVQWDIRAALELFMKHIKSDKEQTLSVS